MSEDFTNVVSATQLVMDFAAIKELAGSGAVAIRTHKRIDFVLLKVLDYWQLSAAPAAT